MPITPLDTPTAVALMLAGALFALGGLWLMARPRGEGGAAKIELFGLKFESSSAGLLVFLIGALFLASPVFVPRLPGVDASAEGDLGEPPPESNGGTGDATTTKPDPVDLTGTAPRWINVVAREEEENDSIAAANGVPVGAEITGEVQAGDPDFFTFEFPSDFAGDVSVNLAGGEVELTVYDDLGGAYPYAHKNWSGEVELARYYASVHTDTRHAPYTLRVAVRPE